MTGLYLYQTVHLARGRARNVAGHIAVLDAASRELFGRPYAPAAERLAKRIETLSAAERYPAGVSGFVRIELDPDGTERLLPAGVSLYDGHGFGLKAPEGVAVVERHPCGNETLLAVGPPFDAHESRHPRRIALRGGEGLDAGCEPCGCISPAEQLARRGVEHGDMRLHVAGAAPGDVDRLI